jgi:hypothetical protein
MTQILLPLAALVVAGLAIAALWLWWSPPANQETPLEVPAHADSPSDPEGGEILRVLRDPSGGMLSIRMNGRLYRSIGEIDSPQTRETLYDALRALDQFAQRPSPGSATSQPLATSTTVIPSPSAVTPTETEVLAAVQTVKPQILPPASMAEQIEDILQGILVETPQMAHRAIHIHQALDGGVRIEVDDRSFDEAEDIPDPSVRALIQNAIREWEMRSGH